MDTRRMELAAIVFKIYHQHTPYTSLGPKSTEVWYSVEWQHVQGALTMRRIIKAQHLYQEYAKLMEPHCFQIQASRKNISGSSGGTNPITVRRSSENELDIHNRNQHQSIFTPSSRIPPPYTSIPKAPLCWLLVFLWATLLHEYESRQTLVLV